LHGLQSQPNYQHGHEKHRTNQDYVHSFSNAYAGNGLLTLLVLLHF
jgi:hypothetical protein